MSIYCQKCGAENRDTARFCVRCGASFASSVPGSSTPPPWQAPPPHGGVGMTGLLPASFFLANRYIIRGKVGHGGMAAVYDAVDTRINRRVAIKEMSDSAIASPADRQKALAQFQQEAWMLASLDHPNLPKVTDVFSFAGKQYLVMNYVDGETVDKILQNRHAPLQEAEVVAWAAQLCDVLSYLHSRNPPIIFRDLKPSNIMIDHSGQVKLIDFGIARMFKPGKTRDTMALGTIGYAAPEQLGAAQSDVRTDIYALGVTLHELLTGHDPTSTPSNLPSVRKLNPNVSPTMEAVITRALEPDPHKRWQSASEIKLRITGVLPSRPLAPPIPPTAGAPLQSRPSRPTTKLLMAVAQLSGKQIAAVVGVLLTLVAIGAWYGAPVLIRYPVIWNNVPSFVIVAPLVYSAVRQPWVASIAHVLIAIVGGLVIGIRLHPGDPTAWRMDLVLIAAILTGLMIEGFVRLLPRLRGKNREEAWQREMAWLVAMAVTAAVIMVGIVWGWTWATTVWLWINAAILGTLGWFLGDLVQQYMFMRQTGLKRGLRGS